MIHESLYSSKSDNWATPQELFDVLDAEFHFDLDPCADETNHKCEKYFTKEQDGLQQNWGGVSSFLQSTLWQTHYRVGEKRIRRSTQA